MTSAKPKNQTNTNQRSGLVIDAALLLGGLATVAALTAQRFEFKTISGEHVYTASDAAEISILAAGWSRSQTIGNSLFAFTGNDVLIIGGTFAVATLIVGFRRRAESRFSPGQWTHASLQKLQQRDKAETNRPDSASPDKQRSSAKKERTVSGDRRPAKGTGNNSSSSGQARRNQASSNRSTQQSVNSAVRPTHVSSEPSRARSTAKPTTRAGQGIGEQRKTRHNTNLASEADLVRTAPAETYNDANAAIEASREQAAAALTAPTPVVQDSGQNFSQADANQSAAVAVVREPAASHGASSQYHQAEIRFQAESTRTAEAQQPAIPTHDSVAPAFASQGRLVQQQAFADENLAPTFRHPGTEPARYEQVGYAETGRTHFSQNQVVQAQTVQQQPSQLAPAQAQPMPVQATTTHEQMVQIQQAQAAQAQPVQPTPTQNASARQMIEMQPAQVAPAYTQSTQQAQAQVQAQAAPGYVQAAQPNPAQAAPTYAGAAQMAPTQAVGAQTQLVESQQAQAMPPQAQPQAAQAMPAQQVQGQPQMVEMRAVQTAPAPAQPIPAELIEAPLTQAEPPEWNDDWQAWICWSWGTSTWYKYDEAVDRWEVI